jgi:hypothetical protein
MISRFRIGNILAAALARLKGRFRNGRYGLCRVKDAGFSCRAPEAINDFIRFTL